MHKIKVRKVNYETIEINVTLPIYTKRPSWLDDGEWEEYSLWDANGDLWEVTHKINWMDRDEEWEIIRTKNYHPHHTETADRILGSGKYACTKEEFEAAVAKAIAFISQIRNAQPEEKP